MLILGITGAVGTATFCVVEWAHRRSERDNEITAKFEAADNIHSD